MKKYLLLSLVCVSTFALSHGGGVDSNGGHYDRESGEYHCHTTNRSGGPCVMKADKAPQPKNR